MLAKRALDTIFKSEASDGELLAALEELKLENLDGEILSEAITRMTEAKAINPDLKRELYELGRFSMDCSGTGGSGLARFNTSTSVAFVLAAAGFKIAKFGARSQSGKSGSFDFLESLGFSKNLPLERVADALSVCGLAFIYAPLAYPHMQRLAPLRKKLGKATLFNFIGPLLNPVHPSSRLMGVSSDRVRKLLAEELRKDSRMSKALLVTSGGNLDEFSFEAASEVSMIDGDELKEFSVSPSAYLLSNADSAGAGELSDYSSRANARVFSEIVAGDDSNSPAYKMVLLNSAAALFALKACSGINEGINLAADLIASRTVAECMATCRRFYGQLS